MMLHLSTDHKHITQSVQEFSFTFATNERRIQRILHTGARLIVLENTAPILLSKSISACTHSL